MDIEEAYLSILHEFQNASQKKGAFKSKHEGYAVILEEMHELWDEVRHDGCGSAMAEEARQVAAMALRFLVDCC